ncbi:MAG: hypothetical protein ABFS46_14370, partial [Myxococcota bacterium]
SGDTTDDPSRMSLYLGDSRSAESTGPQGGAEAEVGLIVEASLPSTPIGPAASPASSPAAPSAFLPTVASIIDTSQLSPPSPDTAGLAYRSDLDQMVFTDSEVNETALFQSTNVWWMTLTGTVLGTGVTTPFNDPGHEEPTGIAYNPDDGHYFISDDSERKVWEVDPGPDALIGTPDDVVTSVDTTEFDSHDPEGVSFDTLRGHLYIADGVNDEVYRLRPGGNGIFDGVPPDGDDVVLQFDTEILGITDPEGVEHNPDDDILYVSGSQYVAETTIDGMLLRLIDLDAVGMNKPAGLAYAPGSNNPGIMRLYVADRGTDNDSDSDQNDGRIYELTLMDEPGTIDLQVNASSDDAEEVVPDGDVKLDGGDLELGFDDEDQQVVGVRFNGVEILQGTLILESYIQFAAEDESAVVTPLLIEGHDVGHAPTFESSDFDVSARPRTSASVAWSPPPWDLDGEMGAAQRTPDLSPIIQEIVDRGDWSLGNSLALFISGSGWRSAESFDGEAELAPVLHVRFPPPSCGNNDREIAEECDGSDFGDAECSDRGCSGGALSCTNQCRLDISTCTGCPICGNGALEFGEECDDGNLDTETCAYQEAACRVCDSSCNLVAGAVSLCGDGIVDPGYGEECDDGNAEDGDSCTNSCTAAFCGDGVTQLGLEECDDGNASNQDGCLIGCVAATCGDGFIQSGVEECDDTNLDDTDDCPNTCLAARCGDGFTQAGVEICDDGNVSNLDSCLTSCVPASCGDGFLWSGVEICDDGNISNLDSCLTSCVPATCGDGFAWVGIEACDDGNADNTDACLDTCAVAACGDGFAQAGVEICDDGNASNLDSCLTSCVSASCGDGFTWGGVEECDDANADNADACLDTCAAASCGDGFLQAGVEICDDGNASNLDSCLTSCVSASCGDGFTWGGVEECDDANADNADACFDTCIQNVPEPSQSLLLLCALALVPGLARRSSLRRG